MYEYILKFLIGKDEAGHHATLLMSRWVVPHSADLPLDS